MLRKINTMKTLKITSARLYKPKEVPTSHSVTNNIRKFAVYHE
jgi:hypothetical protein